MKFQNIHKLLCLVENTIFLFSLYQIEKNGKYNIFDLIPVL